MIYAISNLGTKPQFFVFENEEVARKRFPSDILVKSEKCLSNSNLFSTKLLVDLYNSKAERKIAKFRDRATAEKRVYEVMKKEAIDSESKPKTTRKNRSLDGKYFTTAKSMYEVAGGNPRRYGTHGWHFMEAVLNRIKSEVEKGNPPVCSFEQLAVHYSIKGEKFSHHLRWDLEKGNIVPCDKDGVV